MDVFFLPWWPLINNHLYHMIIFVHLQPDSVVYQFYNETGGKKEEKMVRSYIESDFLWFLGLDKSSSFLKPATLLCTSIRDGLAPFFLPCFFSSFLCHSLTPINIYWTLLLVGFARTKYRMPSFELQINDKNFGKCTDVPCIYYKIFVVQKYGI